MTATRDQLISAISNNQPAQIQSLVTSGIPIHDTANTAYPYTPLQLALSQPTSGPLRSLLTSFFSTAHPARNNEESDAVIDELIVHIFPSHQPPVAESSPEPHRPLQSPKKLNGLKLTQVQPITDNIIVKENGTDIHLQNGHVKPKEDVIVKVERALSAIRRGDFVVVADSADRENEGDLIIAAEKATPEKIAFMVNETSGIICVGIEGSRAEELELPQMVTKNTESHQTAFTVTVDFISPTSTTGISASDRAHTIAALAPSSGAIARQFARPGHIFPLRAKDGGVLVRPGHTEASVDLARLAGLSPAGAMCEIVNKDGTMSRPAELVGWAKRHGLEMISIADLIEYRRRTEKI